MQAVQAGGWRGRATRSQAGRLAGALAAAQDRWRCRLQAAVSQAWKQPLPARPARHRRRLARAGPLAARSAPAPPARSAQSRPEPASCSRSPAPARCRSPPPPSASACPCTQAVVGCGERGWEGAAPIAKLQGERAPLLARGAAGRWGDLLAAGEACRGAPRTAAAAATAAQAAARQPPVRAQCTRPAPGPTHAQPASPGAQRRRQLGRHRVGPHAGDAEPHVRTLGRHQPAQQLAELRVLRHRGAQQAEAVGHRQAALRRRVRRTGSGAAQRRGRVGRLQASCAPAHAAAGRRGRCRLASALRGAASRGSLPARPHLQAGYEGALQRRGPERQRQVAGQAEPAGQQRANRQLDRRACTSSRALPFSWPGGTCGAVQGRQRVACAQHMHPRRCHGKHATRPRLGTALPCAARPCRLLRRRLCQAPPHLHISGQDRTTSAM